MTLAQYLNKPIKVLDHGSVELLAAMGDDRTVDDAARVSFTGGEHGEQRTHEETVGLLRYLMRHRHTTPFEMVVFRFRIVCPIFVWRQIIRHRTASVNELSGRYQVLPDLYYTPEPERIREQATSNKQGSSDDVLNYADHLSCGFADEQRTTRQAYERRLELGMARELARINLPVSQYTAMVWQMDLHNLLHFLALRMDSHAQEETRMYADVIADIVKAACPITWEAFEDFRLGGLMFTRQDLAALAAIGTPSLEAAGYVLMIRNAVAEIKAARKEDRKPDFTKAAAAGYWKTTREAEEFADKVERLFVGHGDMEAAAPRVMPERPRRMYTAADHDPPQDRVLVCDEKHDLVHWAAATDAELYASALKIVQERAASWYTADVQIEARAIVDAADGRGAWVFLQRRTDHEYEHVSLVTPRR